MLWSTPLLLLFIAAAITISRRPDAIFNAQFWAEDGAVWYRDAYTLGGLQATLVPRDGYFQTLARLTAGLGQLLPLSAAPYLFNGIGLLVQILPAAYLASARCAALIPSLPARLFLAFAYLALPGSAETHVNITNGQYRLVLLAMLLVLCPPGAGRMARVADAAVLVLAGLSSITAVFLVPVAAVLYVVRRSPWRAFVLFAVGATAVVQLAALALSPDTRSHDPLGASVELFFRIVGGQIVLSTLAGAQGYWWLMGDGHTNLVLPAAAVGTFVVAYAALRGSLELRLFLLFAGSILAVALLFGQVRSTGAGVWTVLTLPQQGQRYFFFPTIALIAALLWMAAQARSSLAKLTAAGLLAILLVVGIPLDWRLTPLTDLHFAEHARRFEQVAPGTRVTIPVNPPGFTMTLVRH